MSDRPDILVLPPAAMAISLVATSILGRVIPIFTWPPFGSVILLIVGSAFFASGLWLIVTAAIKFFHYDDGVNPQAATKTIITDGPYRHTRNPMYLGLLLIHFGLSLAFSLDWTLVTTPILWAVLHWGVVLREEQYLLEKYGQEYRDFMDTTRRWL